MALWLAGGTHVGMTGWFWFIGTYRRHINARPLYFYAWPASLAVVALVGVTIAGAPGRQLFIIIYTIWLLYHFGRQNWGVLCLGAAATKTARPSDIERAICHLAPIGGIIGALFAVGSDVWLYGLVVALGTAGASLIVAAHQLAVGGSLLRAAMTAMPGLFFLPVYALGPLGLIAVGVAHAYQYALIMGGMAAADRVTAPHFRWAVPLVAVTLYYLAAMLVVLWADWGTIAATIGTLWDVGIIWHFIIDADLWRLSRPFQRQEVQRRLAFLFR